MGFCQYIFRSIRYGFFLQCIHKLKDTIRPYHELKPSPDIIYYNYVIYQNQ